MLHCFSSKLALRALAISALLCLVIFVVFGRSSAAVSGDVTPGPTSRLTVETSAGTFIYDVEIAATEAERERGLMYRSSMEANHGMLFDMGVTAPATFWMHDTFIPLDIIFIAANGRVVSIADEAQPKSDKYIKSAAPVRFVLELNAKRARLMHLKIGDTIRTAVIDQVAGKS